MAAAPPLRDRLSFLHRLPLLLRGTSDDAVPCPGYLFEEIAKISHESLGSSQCLLEYLLSRLHSSSGRVKLKVLKILLYLCGHGSSSFLLILRRNSAFIQEATVFAGPPDPLHGNSLYQKVRAAAQDLGSALFSDAALPLASSQPPRALPAAGMGSQSRPHGALQGFGYSKEQGRAGSAGEAFLCTVQKAAEAVASAVCSGPENPETQRPLPRGDAYQPAVMPSASHSHPAPGNCGAVLGARATRHQPGQAGGGWDEPDSSPGSQASSRSSGLSRASDSGSRSGSDGHSGAGRELRDLAERAEAVAPSDCQQELSLVRRVTRGPRPFLGPEEVQHFLRECGLLNCEAVLELLLSLLPGASESEQTRALSAIAALGHADLLPPELILTLTRSQLQELSAGSPGPVTNKATKILRHFEASCGQRPPAQGLPADRGPAAALQSPADLLTEAVPPTGGRGFLQPLSSALVVPRSPVPTPAPGDPSEAETGPRGCGRQGAGPEQGLWGADGPQSHDSLFAGMELVAQPSPRPATEAPHTAHLAARSPRTLAQKAAATGPPGLGPSAFAFLNV
ncbi:AP-4 complex accessory subunit tepsin isoform X2 [Lepus europaeus]|uniref:AP-4 complex accessory subunit tepsin isoform X2 n=1 Tax=Lepus europaeus TaxID=9983 RepID=UPI002B489B33|nr:AP-4 complex accessory subunit tepsin isoform X2 [Lepus europaeus]